ncbi:hypothetical protein [Streptomyces sp. DASNCL29]|uniref:hypothetical protein n=1 Tax=Streptomyces sp. DASNCL29 TaxID=2583819 RepID=UPI001F0E68A7|nr:hypothetical protein [Streptomyces sp. DASNCL29]
MTTRAAQWTPPNGPDPEALPAGRWWDAVRAPAAIGERTLAFLGTESGAVIQDRCDTLYWLITPGSAASWKLRQVTVLTANEGVATYLGVPPAHRLSRPGSYWRVPFRRARYLTDPWLLYKALAHAVLTEPDTGEEGAR